MMTAGESAPALVTICAEYAASHLALLHGEELPERACHLIFGILRRRQELSDEALQCFAGWGNFHR